jgi:iron(III) transport system permease protein
MQLGILHSTFGIGRMTEATNGQGRNEGCAGQVDVMTTIAMRASAIPGLRPAAGRPYARYAWIGLLVAFLCFIIVYPMAMLVYGSLYSAPPLLPGEINLNGYRQILTYENLALLLNSVGISFLKTLISLALAVLFAWILARTDTPFRRTLEILITLPFFIPPILTAMAWGMLGNPQVGAVNLAWRWATGSQTTVMNVYSYFGVIWHMCQYSTVLIFLFLVDAFRAMDPALEEASRISGAGRFQTFRRITLMLMLPVMSSVFLLSFIRGIESFESPLFFGLPAGIHVITTEIYSAITQRTQPDYQYATALSFAIFVCMALLIVAQWRILGRKSFQTITGKGYAPRIVRLGRWRWVTFSICVLFFLISVVLPIGQLLVGSFFRFFGFYQLNMLTLQNYTAVFDNGEFWRAARNTLLLGLGGATTTMIVGSLVAYVTTRTQWRGRRIVEILAWLPWMTPGIVLGVGFLWAFAVLPTPVPIYGTMWALLLAYVSLSTPVATRIMSSAYAQLSYDLEECSRVHGASWLQTMWRIVIALTWPSFIVGWILTFFIVLRELSVSIMLYSIDSIVLSVVLLKLWSNGRAEQVSVIGLGMMLLVIIFRCVQIFTARARAKQRA